MNLTRCWPWCMTSWSLLCMGCASASVVVLRAEQDRAVVRYRSDDNEPSADLLREKWAETMKSVCGDRGWKIVSDGLENEEFEYVDQVTTVQTTREARSSHIQSNEESDGGETITSQRERTTTTTTPVIRRGVVQWREANVVCQSPVPATQDVEIAATTSSVSSPSSAEELSAELQFNRPSRTEGTICLWQDMAEDFSLHELWVNGVQLQPDMSCKKTIRIPVRRHGLDDVRIVMGEGVRGNRRETTEFQARFVAGRRYFLTSNPCSNFEIGPVEMSDPGGNYVVRVEGATESGAEWRRPLFSANCPWHVAEVTVAKTEPLYRYAFLHREWLELSYDAVGNRVVATVAPADKTELPVAPTPRPKVRE